VGFHLELTQQTVALVVAVVVCFRPSGRLVKSKKQFLKGTAPPSLSQITPLPYPLQQSASTSCLALGHTLYYNTQTRGLLPKEK
ncbi:MAG: hypothetical protein IIX00_03590, partial [Tidjanibacter sp.]|nr:hypothetical protein [Tidjanibacter sp.]